MSTTEFLELQTESKWETNPHAWFRSMVATSKALIVLKKVCLPGLRLRIAERFCSDLSKAIVISGLIRSGESFDQVG